MFCHLSTIKIYLRCEKGSSFSFFFLHLFLYNGVLIESLFCGPKVIMHIKIKKDVKDFKIFAVDLHCPINWIIFYLNSFVTKYLKTKIFGNF